MSNTTLSAIDSELMRIRTELVSLAIEEIKSDSKADRLDTLFEMLAVINEIDLGFEGLEELFLAEPWNHCEIVIDGPALVRLCRTCNYWPEVYTALFQILATARKELLASTAPKGYPQCEELIGLTKEVILEVTFDSVSEMSKCRFDSVIQPWLSHVDEFVKSVAQEAWQEVPIHD